MRAFTCWLAGPPADTRTAFAIELGARFRQRGRSVELLHDEPARRLLDLDGDPDPSRIAYLCSLLVRHGVIVVVAESALADPIRRALCLQLAPTVLVHVDGSGACDPPAAPDHQFRVGHDRLADSIRTVMEILEHRELVPPASSNLDREEALLARRLADLGYL